MAPLTNSGDEYAAQLPGFASGSYVALRIAAEDRSGNMLIYEVAPAFKVALPAPIPTFPPNGWSTGSQEVVFEWQPVPEATSYKVQIDKTPDFDSANLINATVSTTQYSTALSLGTWYWRVIATDTAGNESAHTGERQLRVVRPLVRVTGDPAQDSNPALLQASDGHLWVVWTSWRSGNAELWYKTSTDSGTTWSPDAHRITDTTGNEAPALAEAADGTVWVVWHGHHDGNFDIWYKTTHDHGATWSPALQLTSDPKDDYYPAIARGADGTLWVLWTSNRSGNIDIWYKSSRDNGSTWTADRQLTTDPATDAAPAMIQSSDGKLWVVWSRLLGCSNAIWYKTSADGGNTWSAETQLSGGYAESYPTIAETSDGQVRIAWVSYRSGNLDLWSKRTSDSGTTWSLELQLTRFMGYDADPYLTRLNDGSIAVVWSSNREGNQDVWYGIMEQREDVSPPPYVGKAYPVGSVNPVSGRSITVRAYAADEAGIERVSLLWNQNGIVQPDLLMYDDGRHDDLLSLDGWYGVQFGPFPPGTQIRYQVRATDVDGNATTFPTTANSFEVLAPFRKTGDILFVLDTGTYDTGGYEGFFTSALDSKGYAYDVWKTNLRGTPDSATLSLYANGAVIWAMPYQAGCLAGWALFDHCDGNSTREAVQAYLNAGGRLFITGQGIAETLQNIRLLRDYLHASYVQGDTGLFALKGRDGDPIGDGLMLHLSGGDGSNTQWSKDEIDPIAPAQVVFTYQDGASQMLAEPVRLPERAAMQPRSDQEGAPGMEMLPRPPGMEAVVAETAQAMPVSNISSGTAGLRVDTGTYKVVYFAFGFEGINRASDRALVMQRVLTWLGSTPPCYDFLPPAGVGAEDVQLVAAHWREHPGHPGWDPRFDLNGDGQVTVADILRVAAAWGRTCK